MEIAFCNRVFLLSLLLLPPFLLSAQPPEEEKEEDPFEAAYQQRIQEEYLHGVYIPKDLADAFAQLNELTSRDSRLKYRQAPEEVAVRRLHFSLGRWIIYNWGFYRGSRLSHYLRKFGLSHPDDMARFIMVTWHRQLNKKDLDVKPLLEELIEARKQSYQSELKRDTLQRRIRTDSLPSRSMKDK